MVSRHQESRWEQSNSLGSQHSLSKVLCALPEIKTKCDFISPVQSTVSPFTAKRKAPFLLCVPSKKLLLTLIHGA